MLEMTTTPSTNFYIQSNHYSVQLYFYSSTYDLQITGLPDPEPKHNTYELQQIAGFSPNTSQPSRLLSRPHQNRKDFRVTDMLRDPSRSAK